MYEPNMMGGRGDTEGEVQNTMQSRAVAKRSASDAVVFVAEPSEAKRDGPRAQPQGANRANP